MNQVTSSSEQDDRNLTETFRFINCNSLNNTYSKQVDQQFHVSSQHEDPTEIVPEYEMNQSTFDTFRNQSNSSSVETVSHSENTVMVDNKIKSIYDSNMMREEEHVHDSSQFNLDSYQSGGIERKRSVFNSNVNKEYHHRPKLQVASDIALHDLAVAPINIGSEHFFFENQKPMYQSLTDVGSIPSPQLIRPLQTSSTPDLETIKTRQENEGIYSMLKGRARSSDNLSTTGSTFNIANFFKLFSRFTNPSHHDANFSPVRGSVSSDKSDKFLSPNGLQASYSTPPLSSVKRQNCYIMNQGSNEISYQNEIAEYRTQYHNQFSEYRTPLSKADSNESSDHMVHAQTFVLSLAFLSIWSPQNLMAPNLTQMAETFHFSSSQRDLYLGSNIALATGVLSLPLAAFIGYIADHVDSRKRLFAGTVFMGGVSSWCTGMSQTYAQLFFARFICGGCMSGSVPIAFSLLGDLFDAEDRNVASSGLTAMAGILFGQVYSGYVGDSKGWEQPFMLSGTLSIITSLMVLQFVREPVRGGKEKVLQDMIAKGTKYSRKLTLGGFWDAMTNNRTNLVLIVQGFFTNIPWGILFTFLNDYLSQEKGLSVTNATYLLFWFGLGSASGGVAGGIIGTVAMNIDRAMLPLFMAISTFLGIFPFLGLLNLGLNGKILPVILSFVGGCVANLPSVNVRPCLINVNPPETRGAAMTTANLMINVARGAGPSLITMAQRFCGVSRQYSLNVLIIVFWSISSIQLLVLIKTLPQDQDKMNSELERYAKSQVQDDHDEDETFHGTYNSPPPESPNKDLDKFHTPRSEKGLINLEDRMKSFNAEAAQDSLVFIGNSLREIGEEISHLGQRNGGIRDNYYEPVSGQDEHIVDFHCSRNLEDHFHDAEG